MKLFVAVLIFMISGCANQVPDDRISVTVTGFRIDRSAPNPVAEVNPVLYFAYKDASDDADGDMFTVIMNDIDAPLFELGESWENVMKGIESSELRIINQSSGMITARTVGKNTKIKVDIKYKFGKELLRKYTLFGLDESDSFF
ncbi:MAG: hypothetical protein ACPGJI_06910 [Kangiellaceae bacterium]